MASIVGRAPGRPGAAGWAWLSCWRSTAHVRTARTRDGQIRRDVFMRVSSDDPTVPVWDSQSNADLGRCGWGRAQVAPAALIRPVGTTPNLHHSLTRLRPPSKSRGTELPQRDGDRRSPVGWVEEPAPS